MNTKLTHKPVVWVADRGMVEGDSLYLKACQLFDESSLGFESRKLYKHYIKEFITFTAERGRSEKSFQQFRDYLAQKTNWKANTKNVYLNVAKKFLKLLHKKGDLPKDITDDIKIFSIGKKHKKVGINEDEVAIIMRGVRMLSDTLPNTRLRAILSLLVLQGLRQVEITRLDFEDIDFLNGTAMIQGKGRDDKEAIDLQSETIKHLQTYAKLFKISSGPLFKTQRGRMSTRTLRLIVKTTLTILGIKKSTHGFRHYFATELLKSYKGDLLSVKRYTRHTNVGTIETYNDAIKSKEDLPRFFKTFAHIKF